MEGVKSFSLWDRIRLVIVILSDCYSYSSRFTPCKVFWETVFPWSFLFPHNDINLIENDMMKIDQFFPILMPYGN